MLKRLKDLCYVFACVTTCVTFVTAVYLEVFWTNQASLTADILWQILFVSLFCSLGIMIYPEREVSGRMLLLLYILHYIEVNVVVLGCGIWFEWFYPDDLPMVLGMVAAIAIVYVLVTAVKWNRDRKMAEHMNERLEEYQRREKETSESAGSEKMNF